MPEMHLKQPGFTYSDCGLFTKNKERIGKFMHTGNTDFIYKSELDKACFQHDFTYGKSKHLAKRTQSDKVLRDKESIDGLHGLTSMVYKFFDKKSSGSGMVLLMNQIMSSHISFINQLLENSEKEKFIHHLEIIFGALI